MASPKYIAAIDSGTTGTRCIIFDRSARIVDSAYEEHRQIYPQPGCVEHDAEEIWTRTRGVIGAALAKARLTPADLLAAGITNQRETIMLWDPATGKPLHNALVWQDTRTAAVCDQLRAGGAEAGIRERTGLPLATYFSATKLAWLLDHIPGARDRAARGEVIGGTIDSWLIWNLTGRHVTDVTNASRTQLMNLRTLAWDDELLRQFNIPAGVLPRIVSSSDAQAYGVARGVLAGVPICGDLGDQQAALFGQACYTPGDVKNTYGTGCFMLLNTGARPVVSQHGLLTTPAYKIGAAPAVYALEGSVAIAGAAIQWLRDNLGLIQQAGETEAIAATVADSGGAYFVPAFSGLYAPYWDATARGALVGLTRYITRAHIVRATLEAICYQTRDVLDAMRMDMQTGMPGGAAAGIASLKVDGGATVNRFLMQLQADILGVSVVKPVVNETTALGAAYAAGLAVGMWSNLDELKKQWLADQVYQPHWGNAQREAGYRGWQRAIEKAKGWEVI
ncbi:MAG: glycerol kinase GlpK [Chloroflexi bacterium]|nr:glycerol kinase GlpK [Chloroflexota bacterium]MCL5274350.1 glycerol kinase GlpK [Chloroflexota bacterium]